MYTQDERPMENFSGQKDLLYHEAPILTLGDYAGFWLRFAALMIDMVIFFVFNAIVLGILGINFINSSDPEAALTGVLGYYGIIQIGAILYFTLMESSAWQATLGKRAVGIIVTDLNGQRISFPRALGRYFGKILSGIVLLIGYIMAAFTDRKQALHDLVASTLVIKGNAV
jgi:uncharacterized RDD family membrane protein YckC